MNAEICFKAYPAVERYTESSKDLSVSLKTTENDGMRLSVECFQIFNDKSKISLSAKALQFYLPHVTFLKVLEESRQKLNFSERTVVVYLPGQSRPVLQNLFLPITDEYQILSAFQKKKICELFLGALTTVSAHLRELQKQGFMKN